MCPDIVNMTHPAAVPSAFLLQQEECMNGNPTRRRPSTSDPAISQWRKGRGDLRLDGVLAGVAVQVAEALPGDERGVVGRAIAPATRGADADGAGDRRDRDRRA